MPTKFSRGTGDVRYCDDCLKHLTESPKRAFSGESDINQAGGGFGDDIMRDTAGDRSDRVGSAGIAHSTLLKLGERDL